MTSKMVEGFLLVLLHNSYDIRYKTDVGTEANSLVLRRFSIPAFTRDINKTVGDYGDIRRG